MDDAWTLGLEFLRVFAAWPFVAFLLVLLFRKQLRALLEQLSERTGQLSVGPVSVTLQSANPKSENTEANTTALPAGPVVRTVYNQKYESQEVEIDGIQFVTCEFKSVTFIFRGRREFGFNNCTLSEVLSRFEDQAGITVEALRRIYQGFGDYGKELIDFTLKQPRLG